MKIQAHASMVLAYRAFALVACAFAACSPAEPAKPVQTADAAPGSDVAGVETSPLDTLDAQNIDADSIEAVVGPAADASATDADSAGTEVSVPAAISPVVDQGPAYTLTGTGCAVPAPPVPSAKCASVVCPAGQACMGAGHCLPAVPVLVDETAVAALHPSVATNGEIWGLAYAFGTPEAKSLNIRVRFFSADNMDLGEVQTLTNDTVEMHSHPQLFSIGGDDWLVGWKSEHLLSGYSSLSLRRVTTLGVGGGQTVVFAPAVSEWWFSLDIGPRLAHLPGANSFALVWAAGANGEKHAVYAQPLSRTAEFLGPVVKLSNAADWSWSAGVTSTPTGAFAVWAAWLDAKKSNVVRIKGRRLDALGKPDGPEFMLPEFGKVYEGQPSVQSFADGSVVVVRALGNTQIQSVPVKYQTILLSQPTAQAASAQLAYFGEDTSPMMFNAPIAGHFPGRAVAMWQDYGDYGLTGSVYLKRYYRNANAFDCEATDLAVPIIPGTKAHYAHPSIATFSDGRILAAWQATVGSGTPNKLQRIALRFLPQ